MEISEIREKRLIEKKIQVVSKEKFESLLLDYSIPFEDRKNLVVHDWGLPLPSSLQDGDEFLNFVYEHYLKVMDDYLIYDNQKFIKQKNKSEETRKEFITNIIRTKDIVTYQEIVNQVNEKYGYAEIGKSPSTRIRNTLKELILTDKIAIGDNDEIKWIGK